ncbi:nucleotide exchange factor GrpE [Pseudoduganella sp. SL102]|uniref:Protein GrpE n=1 Tax=Pseudoduganella albidiflava TaxID=321983 RepID=A0A411WSB0_9BURK|nr:MULTISPECIES: nucleotide exchange factor GrpE [Pseudoduganella]QBH99531.1 nucleotide exchange factor GrpE [Pseudoduganella albidiflava]WBS02514.1 nucleotide exchange factor GrpE [Pseudoduganella sp. SL102]GGY45554.1 protein GrpE [Pseudoduganella albidiflava]
MQDQENQASQNPEDVQQAAQAQQQAPQQPSQQQAPSESAANPSLEEQLSATEAKLAEMHDAFMRAKAEADNIRRRAQEDVAKAHKFAVESFAEALLPVKDSLEMALKVETPSVESLKEGVEMTLKQLTSAFERNKLLEVVPAAGDKLDPNRHQAVAMVPAEQEANTVVAVLQKGYTIADRLLRPAIVTAAQPK